MTERIQRVGARERECWGGVLVRPRAALEAEASSGEKRLGGRVAYIGRLACPVPAVLAAQECPPPSCSCPRSLLPVCPAPPSRPRALTPALWPPRSNLTGLAGVAGALLNTTEGAALFAALPGSNKTILAPNNEAFNMVNQSVASNTSLLTQILSYHVLNGSVMPGNSTSLYRSFYNSMMLPGNA